MLHFPTFLQTYLPYKWLQFFYSSFSTNTQWYSTTWWRSPFFWCIPAWISLRFTHCTHCSPMSNLKLYSHSFHNCLAQSSLSLGVKFFKCRLECPKEHTSWDHVWPLHILVQCKFLVSPFFSVIITHNSIRFLGTLFQPLLGYQYPCSSQQAWSYKSYAQIGLVFGSFFLALSILICTSD